MDRGDRGPVVLWRLGDALLAVELEAVVEIVPIGADGQATTRTGPLEVVIPVGLRPDAPPRRAVVIRRDDRADETRMAIAADDVEGVVEPGDASAVDPPPWLPGLDSSHFQSLIRLADHRLAALLDVATLFQDR